MSVQTKQSLGAALKKLLSKKTLDRITVKDITDECGVNRQTFYYHFKDIYDLVEWIMDEDIRKYSEAFITDDWKSGFRVMLEGFYEQKSFMINVFYSLDSSQLARFLQGRIMPTMRLIIENAAGERGISDEDRFYVTQFFTYAMAGVVTEWVTTGMSVDNMDELLDKQFRIMDGLVEYTLSKFEKED